MSVIRILGSKTHNTMENWWNPHRRHRQTNETKPNRSFISQRNGRILIIIKICFSFKELIIIVCEFCDNFCTFLSYLILIFCICFLCVMCLALVLPCCHCLEDFWNVETFGLPMIQLGHITVLLFYCYV